MAPPPEGGLTVTKLYAYCLAPPFAKKTSPLPCVPFQRPSRPTSRPAHSSRPQPQHRAAVRHIAKTPPSHRLNLPYSVGIAATALFNAAIFS